MARHSSSFATFIIPFLPGWGKHQYAVYSACGLVAVQVAVGIIIKGAQARGTYSFSPSASVTISEALKMLLSMLLFYRECKARDRDAASERRSILGESRPLASELPAYDVGANEEERDMSRGGDIDDVEDSTVDRSMPRLSLRTFFGRIRREASEGTALGLCNLALFYVLINNLIFISYQVADPATIQLTKSSVTFITAWVLKVALNKKISYTQWVAIILQICGLVVTQYSPELGAVYPIGTYALLLLHVFLSAVSGVYNQTLLKTEGCSLHASNLILYGAGAGINALCHIMLRALKEDEPGFFEGYGSIAAIMVIVSNVFIGLAINAVYKYADAIVKCLATAVATAILLYVSPIIFGTTFEFLVLPGTIVVFAASWLYAGNAEPQNQNPKGQKSALGCGWGGIFWKFKRVCFLIALLSTLAVVAALNLTFSGGAGGTNSHSAPKPTQATKSTEKVFSPFKDSLAFIRWNSAFPERIPLLMKYQPFFHTIHISMPDRVVEHGVELHNLTYDQFSGTFTIYTQVAHTMRLILETEPHINGLLYFHFDAWIDPLAWSDMNNNKIHYPAIINENEGPPWVCMTDVKEHSWWGWGEGFHNHSMEAASAVKSSNLSYTVQTTEWCLGWSDIYYIPRRFFEDFIYLSEVFVQYNVMHEVAIPTMVHIIDNSRRKTPHIPVIDHISDCWGSCCRSGPRVKDVLENRCGHRLDYRDEVVTNTFYKKIEDEKHWLRFAR